MKEHVEAAWGHLHPGIQHVIKTVAVGAAIGGTSALLFDTAKRIGIPLGAAPGQANQPGSTGYRQNWTGNVHHRRHHTHHWQGRS